MMNENPTMPDDSQQDDPLLDAAAARGHEDAGLHVWGIVATAVALFVLAVVSLGIVALIMRSQTDADASGVTASQQWRRQAVNPGVTPNQTDERQREDAHLQRQLHGYAWQDADHRVARIPIERAMQLLAARQLQVDFTPTVTNEVGEAAASPAPEATR